jgi:hypothetical protein
MYLSQAGTTLKTLPAIIPQKAASAVIVLLQILKKLTGPHDDAKTVPIKSISQKTLAGVYKLIARNKEATADAWIH